MLSEKIVVIDDDPRIIKSLKLGLVEYEITSFTNGNDALAYLRKPNLVSIILLDVRMPGMDGLSVLEAIRETNKNIIVIMLTAYATKDIAIQALRNRADDFIEKPFRIDELKGKIRGHLRSKLRNDYPATDKGNKVERMKSFILRNYKDATLESIAHEMYLSPKYISRMFRSKNELSFRDFKIKVKMDRAKDLLRADHMNINEIALELGYQNPESFMRLFKRMNHVTPSEYRKSSKNKQKSTSKKGGIDEGSNSHY